MPVEVKVDIEQISKTIGINARVMEPQMANAAIIKFNLRKKKFLNKFDNHTISKELVAGPGAYSELFEWGSLFAFIGFDKDDYPIDKLNRFFNSAFKPPSRGKGSAKSINIVSKREIDYIFSGYRPNLKEIAQETPWPWKGTGSWALDIEQGKFLRYANYIFGHFENVPSSHSGRGLQAKSNGKLVRVRNDRPQKMPYIRKLLSDFDRNKFDDDDNN